MNGLADCGISIQQNTFQQYIKMNKLLTHFTTWMNLRSILLSEGNQTQRTVSYMIPFTLTSRKGNVIMKGSRSAVARC